MAQKEHITLGQEQRLQQRLSPLQVRYVQLLEMNVPEVEDAVIRELEENPALEAEDPKDIQQLTDEGEHFSESAEQMQQADYRSSEDIPFSGNVAPRQPADPGYDPLANMPDSGTTLYDYITQYLDEQKLEPDVAAVARYIAGCIDSNGYLRRPLRLIADDMAFNEGVELPMSVLEKGLQAIQRIEPAGIGAENLQQCLLLQLDRQPLSLASKDARRIVADYFEPFSMKHYHKIESALKMTPERLSNALSRIHALNPKPGAAIGSGSSTDAKAISPDCIVEEDDNGKFFISIPSNIPELHIVESFEEAFRHIEANKKQIDARHQDGYKFAISRYNDARDFIRAISMRRQTLFAIFSAIVRLQQDYFRSLGDEHQLHPMALKDISRESGYDLSVISRATAGKYMLTPWGIKPLRFFFSERLGQGESQASSRKIQAEIKRLISHEDKRHPLSDDRLCSILAEMGYTLSRRTTAKYRDRLGIPVARLRREI